MNKYSWLVFSFTNFHNARITLVLSPKAKLRSVYVALLIQQAGFVSHKRKPSLFYEDALTHLQIWLALIIPVSSDPSPNSNPSLNSNPKPYLNPNLNSSFNPNPALTLTLTSTLTLALTLNSTSATCHSPLVEERGIIYTHDHACNLKMPGVMFI